MSAIRIRMIVWRVIDVAVLRAVRLLRYMFSRVHFYFFRHSIFFLSQFDFPALTLAGPGDGGSPPYVFGSSLISTPA